THSLISTLSLSSHTPSPYIYTLSLHDALPICGATLSPVTSHTKKKAVPTKAKEATHVQEDPPRSSPADSRRHPGAGRQLLPADPDRKSTRLNSSHVKISYAVFCLKKKTNCKPS